MKTILKYSITALLLTILATSIQAQSPTKKTTSTVHHSTNSKKKTVNKAAPAVVKEVTITLKNSCERTVGIFAGPKEDLHHPKLKEVGGLSTNTLYLKTNQVVCVMSADGKKAMACTNLKPITTYVEIAGSGTEISAK